MAKRHRKSPKQPTKPRNDQQLVVYNPQEGYTSELRDILRKHIDVSIEQFIFSYLFFVNNLI
jgi:hypothetical protein